MVINLIKSSQAIICVKWSKEPTFQEPSLSLSSGIFCNWIPQMSPVHIHGVGMKFLG